MRFNVISGHWCLLLINSLIDVNQWNDFRFESIWIDFFLMPLTSVLFEVSNLLGQYDITKKELIWATTELVLTRFCKFDMAIIIHFAQKLCFWREIIFICVCVSVRVCLSVCKYIDHLKEVLTDSLKFGRKMYNVKVHNIPFQRWGQSLWWNANLVINV